MQLKRAQRRKRVRESLTALSASLLAATISAQGDVAAAQDHSGSGLASSDNTFGPGIGYSELNSALLVYQEAGGRVVAIEPSASLTINGSNGQVFTLGAIFDAVSGATPNGAVSSNQAQIFSTPFKSVGASTGGGTTTVTSASGGSTIVRLPSTAGAVSYGTRQYTVAPNVLPVDKGFSDLREAFNFGWSQPLGAISQLGFGGGYSIERDYRAITADVHTSQNFNSDNTTVSLALNTELDSSFPYGGVPTAFTEMSGVWKTPYSKDKTQLGFVLGVTEVISRHWLMQLNYSYDTQSGYQNDPYRVISVVNATSGEPIDYLYENRPSNRQSQSLFWNNKFDFGPSVTDLSLRYFKDSWGITSKTAELSERIALGSSVYFEPSARWYQQSAANFFRNYLVEGQALPTYASSDSRLAAFSSLTYGLKVGFNLTGRTELYFRGGYYQPTGITHPAGAIGQLAQQDLFGGTNATFAFIGYTWDFH